MIDRLPADTLATIAAHVTAVQDRCTLSAASSRLRAAVAPFVFRSFKATSRAADAAAIYAVVAAHGFHVRHLTLVHPVFAREADGGGDDDKDKDKDKDRDNDDDDDDDEDGRPNCGHLSSVAADLLSGRALPLLHSLTVDLVPRRKADDADDQDEAAAYILFGAASTEISTSRARAAETHLRWRRALSDLWRHTASNPTVRSLRVRGLLPLLASSWSDDPAWPAFLARLDALGISMWGGDNGVGWEAVTLKPYRRFLRDRLAKHFFAHAVNVRDLDFAACPRSAWGGEGMSFDAPTALDAAQLPRLRRLTLRNCFLDAPLREFLRKRVGKLEALRFHDCMAPVGWSSDDDDSGKWADVFAELVRAGPAELREFSVAFGGVDGDAVREALKERGKGVAKAAGAEGKTLFNYSTRDDKYGYVTQDEEKIADSVVAGADQEAYERLMGVVRANNRKARGEGS